MSGRDGNPFQSKIGILGIAALAMIGTFGCASSVGKSTEKSTVTTSGAGTTSSPPVNPGLTYYVNNQVACNDDGNGTASEPFCMIQTGIDRLAAGDTLLISDGVYPENLEITSAASGSLQWSTTIKAVGNNVVLQGNCSKHPCSPSEWGANWPKKAHGITIQYVKNLIIDGLTMQDYGGQGIDALELENVQIINNTFLRIGGTAAVLTHIKDLVFAHNHLEYVNIGRARQPNPSGPEVFSKGQEGVSFVKFYINSQDQNVGQGDNIEIAHNTIRNTFHEGIATKVLDSATIHDNVAEYACAVGIGIWEGQNQQVFKNITRYLGWVEAPMDINDPSGNGWFDYQYFFTLRNQQASYTGPLPAGSVVECFNDMAKLPYYQKVQGTGIGIATCDLASRPWMTRWVSDIQIYENVVHDTQQAGISSWDHCRLQECGNLNTRGCAGEFYNTTFSNNTLTRIGLDPVRQSSAIYVEQNSVNAIVANNIIADSDGSMHVGSTYPYLSSQVGPLNNPNVSSFTESSTLTNQLIYNTQYSGNGFLSGQNPILDESPQFVNEAAGNFTLQSTSPAIDQAASGFPMTSSVACSARDIGAFEFPTCP